jgi:hypothetical protein
VSDAAPQLASPLGAVTHWAVSRAAARFLVGADGAPPCAGQWPAPMGGNLSVCIEGEWHER